MHYVGIFIIRKRITSMSEILQLLWIYRIYVQKCTLHFKSKLKAFLKLVYLHFELNVSQRNERTCPPRLRDVKSWIPKILNPYFDKLDRIDRMTGARRLYRRPFTKVQTR